MPRDGKRPLAAPENSPPQALRVRAVCWPIALSKAGARFSPTWGSSERRRRRRSRRLHSPVGLCRQRHEACDVLRPELHPRLTAQGREAEGAEILVEVAELWRDHDRLDPGRVRPFDQAVARTVTGRIVIAQDQRAAIELAYAPLGALYAAAFAREAGHKVALFDAMLAESEADWDSALDQHRPAVAVLFEDSFNYLSKMCLLRMRTAVMRMIAAARDRGIPVVVAGSDATDHPDMYLDQGAAAVIAGEGEVTLVQLLDALRRGMDPASLDGVVVRRNGALVRTPPTLSSASARFMRSIAEWRSGPHTISLASIGS